MTFQSVVTIKSACSDFSDSKFGFFVGAKRRFLTSLFNILCHGTTVPACRSDTLTSMLPQLSVMPQTQVMASHPVTVLRHEADNTLSSNVIWNVIFGATTFMCCFCPEGGFPSQSC